MSTPRLAVAGAGSIGIGLALAFARAGASVGVWDPHEAAREAADAGLAARLDALFAHGLLDEAPQAVRARITITAALEEAVAEAVLVHECAPEDLSLKRALFERVAPLAPDAVLASATSALPPSAIAEGLEAAPRVLVAHPANPPYLLPVMELVPGPSTAAETMERAERLFGELGFSPVRLEREIEGFVFNRLQGAVLREAYRLVRDGIATVEDVDKVVRDGLGLRYALIGPFETADLNVRGGIPAHAARMGEAYRRMGALRGENDPWTEDLVAEVERQRREVLPLDGWEERVRWRDEALMRLLAARRREEKGGS